jgi:FkbM family methyltransferase
MNQMIKMVFDRSLNMLVSRKWQIKIARRILNTNLGEGDGDPENNGEYYLLDKIREHYCTKERFVIFDVGANLGEWTAKAAQGMNSNWNIHVFEPSRETFSRLKGLESQKFAAGICLHNVGMSDESGKAEFYICGEAAGTNSLYKRQAEALGVNQRSRETVMLEQGDKFCRANGIKHIDFMKIDTEGHELSVLKGFSNMLSNREIDMVQFEYGGSWVDSRIFLMDAFNYLLDKGYCLGKIYPRGVKVFTAYDQRLENFVYSNYIAFKPDNEFINKLKI